MQESSAMFNAKFHWFSALPWVCGAHPYPGLLLSGMGALLFPHVIARFISLLTQAELLVAYYFYEFQDYFHCQMDD